MGQVKIKTCPSCGSQFICGSQIENEGCWCSEYPQILPLDITRDCFCPVCLKEKIKGKIAKYLKTITPENARDSIAPSYATSDALIEGIDYELNQDGKFILSAWYLLKRGHCCENGCTNCPYGYQKP